MTENISLNPPPMSGVRVLDLTRVLSGPYCALMLADLGADVIKIENTTTGDETRRFTPPEIDGLSTYFLGANRNKRSLALDLKQEDAKEILRDLVKQSDVLVENFRPDVMQRLGLGYEELRQINPNLIYCAISGYGSTGSLAGDPGFDPVVQAESGLMSLTGEPDGDPMRTGISLVDMFTGLHAAQAISGALVSRYKNGTGGQYVAANLFQSGLAMLANFASMYLMTGENPTRVGNGNQVSQPVGVFQASDGGFMVAVANDVQFQRLARDVLKDADLAADPRFATPTDRNNNKHALIDLLNTAFAERPRKDWVTTMKKAGVPAGEIRTVEEALNTDIVGELGHVGTYQHAELGPYRALGSAMNFPEAEAIPNVGAPLLGEHTRDILSEDLGYDDDRIQTLITKGAIRTV